MQYCTVCQSPVGTLTLSSDGESLTGLWIEGQKYHGSTLQAQRSVDDDLPVFAAARDWLNRYFNGEQPMVSELSLAPAGSPFRQKVWKILCRIPYGRIITYGDIAKQVALAMGRPSMSGQAAGGAVGHNPISIIIPCHRVVGAGGSLTGYAGGIGIKSDLLLREGVDLSRLTVPKKGTAL